MTNQRIAWFILLTFIHWIAIYPVDSVIQSLNNWGLQAVMEITRELPHDYSKISEVKDLRSTYIANCRCVDFNMAA